MPNNLYALTRGGPFPAYVSVNRTPTGMVAVTVRDAGRQVGVAQPGQVGAGQPVFGHNEATFFWTREEFEAFKKEINQC